MSCASCSNLSELHSCAHVRVEAAQASTASSDMRLFALHGRLICGQGLWLSCVLLQGCLELLDRSGVEIAGKKAVVIGRSNIVGMPVALLLQVMPPGVA